ncbi:MAG TPA: hypothetical protein VM686_36635 [Polyangiaceae bacterium]|jgi:hypothetical protein|nr:hypothetical protein [Polyangiaceae bacterium]
MQRVADFSGTYRLVVSDEHLAFIERSFVEPAPAGEREAVRAEALREAADAEIEIEADGTFVSRSQGQEFYRTSLAAELSADGEVSFQKPDGQLVTLRFLGRETVLALQDGKPPSTFQRR